MDEQRLRAAMVLLEQGSLRQSARLLHCSQSALSDTIKALERDLGCTLFERGAQGMQPVHGSELLFESFRTLINHMSKTRGLAQDLAAGIAGRVRLQMVTSVTEFFMPALVGKWDQQAPGLALEAEVSHPLRQLDALRRSRCDVALIRRGPSDDQFAEHLVMREPLVVIFPAIWRKNRTIMQLSDLSREAMVSLGPAHGPGLTSDIDLAFQKAAFEPTVAHVTDSMDTLLALVAAGIGWSVVPASLIRRHPDDLGVLHNAIQETTDLVALVRSDDDHPAVQRFLTVAILVGEQVSNTVRQAIMKHRESYKR